MKIFYILTSFTFYFSATSSVLARYDKCSETTIKDSLINNEVHEEGFVLINGIQQWITINGDRSKPVILFLHGGPGSTMSPYADNLYKTWEKDFVIVQWDQRGAGKTYGHDAPQEITPEYLQLNPLTIQQMADDGIAVSKYLLQHLGKQKIILFGTSWGSALGVMIATKSPGLFYAYVGHSQIVNPSSDTPLYIKVHELAVNSNDKQSLHLLDSIGKPPYDRARTVGQLWKIVKKYERQNSIPAPDSWFKEAPDYDNEKDDKNRSDGDDYSFVNFVGDKRLGVAAMRSSINFLKNNTDFKIPVYLIQGEEDILTPKETTREYFDKITAPKKEYFLLPKTAHGFNESVLEMQYTIFKSIKAS